MSNTDKPMHPEFALWHQSIEIGEDSDRRQKRWAGVLETANQANYGDLETLLRLAYQTRHKPAQDSDQRIREFFREHDESFQMSGNDRELQVLAGASLAVMMESTSYTKAESAALSVTTTSLGNGRRSDLPMDLAALGEHAIKTLGEENRERPSLSVPGKTPTVDFQSSVAKLNELQSWEGAKAAFTLAGEATQKALGTLAQRQRNTFRDVAKFIEVQDEELQMLWWLIGQHSGSYSCAFSKVPAEAQPFAFASDLADVTAVLPGPPSVHAILSRSISKGRSKISIAKAVNALDPGWLQSTVEGVDPSPVSTPLHFAIKRQLETGQGDAWVANWAAATEVSDTHSLSRTQIAELFYRERLLMLFE